MRIHYTHTHAPYSRFIDNYVTLYNNVQVWLSLIFLVCRQGRGNSLIAFVRDPILISRRCIPYSSLYSILKIHFNITTNIPNFAQTGFCAYQIDTFIQNMLDVLRVEIYEVLNLFNPIPCFHSFNPSMHPLNLVSRLIFLDTFSISNFYVKGVIELDFGLLSIGRTIHLQQVGFLLKFTNLWS